MNDQFYVSVCPDTGRVFVCELGKDNNIAEIFARNDKETAEENANLVCNGLNQLRRKP